MAQKQVERQSLIVSTLINAFIGLAGIIVYIITDLNAMFLDGVFSLIAFLSSLAAVFISQYSFRRTATFPQGLFFLEPLYAIIKSLATLFLLIMVTLETSATAYAYFIHGYGHPMKAGPVVPYTISMVLICFGLGFYNMRKNRQIDNMSTILEAEARGNFVDGIISAGVGIAFFLLLFIPIESQLGFLHYTGDFFITLVLVLLSVKEPLTVLKHSFKELTKATSQDSDLQEQISQILNPYLVPNQDQIQIYIYKQGMQITVRLQLLSKQADEIADLIKQKENMLAALEKKFDCIAIEYVF